MWFSQTKFGPKLRDINKLNYNYLDQNFFSEILFKQWYVEWFQNKKKTFGFMFEEK